MSLRRSGVTVVIPARMASSRFPGKPLVPILGLPMIEHVRRRSLLAPNVDRVVVATCDRVIHDAVVAAGGLAVMTRDSHERCTDRVQEAMLGLRGDVVVMVQGDEPLLDPAAISLVSEPLLADDAIRVTNLLSPLESLVDLDNPDIVKAVCNRAGDVMFLTRAAVPYFRKRRDVPVYRQTGVMAFRVAFLHEFSSLPPTPLEDAESVDMLRVLEHGVPIRGVVALGTTLGVDRPEDVAAAEAGLRSDPLQRRLHDQILSQDVAP
jgi:3-deoxy-manno-octulosonate cytidylyltransferase (CMP-KDO synthetase)